MTTAKDVRRLRARELKDAHGGLTAFAERVGLSPSQASQIVGRNPVRWIGDDLARRIEAAFGKPLGYLDAAGSGDGVPAPALDLGGAPMGDAFAHAAQSPIATISLSPAWVALRADGANLRTLVVAGDAMAPSLADGDFALVDIAPASMTGPGVFVIGFGGRVYVRRLAASFDGSVAVTADNPAFPSQTLPAGAPLRLLGRVVYAFAGHSL